MSGIKLYDTEARMELVMNSGPRHYTAHVNHMTTEDLRSKSDIAVELAWRDLRIEQLVVENTVLQQACVHVYNVGYNRGHLNTVDGISSCGDYEEDAFEALYEVAATPATTQALNEIKAQGVEEQVSRLEAEYGEIDDVCAMVFRDLREFAASLRGEQNG